MLHAAPFLPSRYKLLLSRNVSDYRVDRSFSNQGPYGRAKWLESKEQNGHSSKLTKLGTTFDQAWLCELEYRSCQRTSGCFRKRSRISASVSKRMLSKYTSLSISLPIPTKPTASHHWLPQQASFCWTYNNFIEKDSTRDVSIQEVIASFVVDCLFCEILSCLRKRDVRVPTWVS